MAWTKDEADIIRNMLEVITLMQNEIDSISKVLDIMRAKTQEELNAVVGKRIHKSSNLKDTKDAAALRKEYGVPGNGEHDYFYAFNPDNPDIPTD